MLGRAFCILIALALVLILVCNVGIMVHRVPLQNEVRRVVYEVINRRQVLVNSVPVPNPAITRSDYLSSPVFTGIDQMISRISARGSGRFLLLLVSTSSYNLVTVNWLCNLYRNVPELLPHVLILSTDAEHAHFFIRKNVTAVYMRLR